MPESSPTSPLTAERVGTRTFDATNARGARVLVGPSDVPGAFTPGELLQVALAACLGMSGDHRLAKDLGDDFPATLTVTARSDDAEDRYADFDVTLRAPLGRVDEERRAHLTERTRAAMTHNCTVGHTLAAGAPYRLHIMESER